VGGSLLLASVFIFLASFRVLSVIAVMAFLFWDLACVLLTMVMLLVVNLFFEIMDII